MQSPVGHVYVEFCYCHSSAPRRARGAAACATVERAVLPRGAPSVAAPARGTRKFVVGSLFSLLPECLGGGGTGCNFIVSFASLFSLPEFPFAVLVRLARPRGDRLRLDE